MATYGQAKLFLRGFGLFFVRGVFGRGVGRFLA